MTHQTTSGHHLVHVTVTATMTGMIVMVDMMKEKAVWHVIMNMGAGVLTQTGHYLVTMAGNIQSLLLYTPLLLQSTLSKTDALRNVPYCLK